MYQNKYLVMKERRIYLLMIRCSEGCERRALNSVLLQLSSHQKRNSWFTYHLNRPTNEIFTYESYQNIKTWKWVTKESRASDDPDRLIYHQSSNRYMIIVFENENVQTLKGSAGQSAQMQSLHLHLLN